MPDADLTQTEADHLIGLAKFRVDARPHPYPSGGGSVSIPLVSEDRREAFSLDLWRARINLTKSRHQNRARQIVPLLRLDIGSAPHRNPDGAEIAGIHLHRYREGFGDKWAEPIPAGIFRDLANPMWTLDDFMRYCNVVEAPLIQASWLP